MMLFRFNIYSFAILSTAVLCVGCSSNSSSDSTVTHPDQLSQVSASKDKQSNVNKSFDIENFPLWKKEALKRLLQNERFRLPKAASFNIPEAAKKDKYARIDIETAIARPYIIGDINHDGYHQDIALIIEDSTSNENERFSIVIFNEPTNRKTIPDPIWLYKARDLSKTTLNWWSGGLSIRTYKEDGKYILCYVNWDAKNDTYLCEDDWRK